jgi:hypothetical protein
MHGLVLFIFQLIHSRCDYGYKWFVQHLSDMELTDPDAVHKHSEVLLN